MTPKTKSPSSKNEKESYKNKKYDKLATNHLKQELLHEIKHYILSLQQTNKTDYIGLKYQSHARPNCVTQN